MPISLLSAVRKFFERIIVDFIIRHLKGNALLSDNHFGFRYGRSASDHLLLFSRDWQKTLDTGLGTIVVALDIAIAFDRMWYAGLQEKLLAKNIRRHLLMLMDDYL